MHTINVTSEEHARSYFDDIIKADTENMYHVSRVQDELVLILYREKRQDEQGPDDNGLIEVLRAKIEPNLKALKRWEHPKDYFGETYYEYFPVIGRHRDSGILENSNFECILKELGGEKDNIVIVSRASHWAVGWVESIMVHYTDTETLHKADEIMCAISDYPVFNETDFSQREWEAKAQYWQDMDLKERMKFCANHNTSIFAARSESIPGDLDQYIDIDIN